jgi:hypothetical protein
MEFMQRLTDLVGAWSGTSRLWLMPGDPGHDSDSTAQVEAVAQGQFFVLRYTWAFEGDPHDGMIVFPSGASETSTRSVWLDSWHMADAVMVCDTTRDGDVVSLHGSYAAPPGPDWGWRIEIEPGEGSSLVVRMFNITPDGEEALAVLAEYERAGD